MHIADFEDDEIMLRFASSRRFNVVSCCVFPFLQLEVRDRIFRFLHRSERYDAASSQQLSSRGSMTVFLLEAWHSDLYNKGRMCCKSRCGLLSLAWSRRTDGL